ncbi:MAG: hypothetical protein EBR63_02290, partial [Actinobacteria bacterium]|nr:hypothetical protein [Actinomycetota bacterium]
ADAAPVAGCDADDFVLGEGVLERVASGDRCRVSSAVLGENVPPAAHGFGDQHRTFDDEQALVDASRTSRQQPTKLLNPLV